MQLSGVNFLKLMWTVCIHYSDRIVCHDKGRKIFVRGILNVRFIELIFFLFYLYDMKFSFYSVFEYILKIKFNVINNICSC